LGKDKFDVWAAVKDPGGMAGVLPVVDKLQEDGLSVLLIANGKAVELFAAQGREHFTASNASQVMRKYEKPKLYLTSMCSRGGVGRDLIPFLKGEVPTIALQDAWGSLLKSDWADPTYWPDYIVTNDVVGKRIILERWSGFSPDHVLVTGFPALDKYVPFNFNVAGVGGKVREDLGLSKLPIVLFAGQGVGSAHALGELVKALNEIEGRFYLLPRSHPRIATDFPSEIGPWLQALAGFRGKHIRGADDYTMQQLLAAVAQWGFVVSMYSTTLLEAAAWRIPAISMLFPGEGRGLEAMQKSLSLDKYPLAELGAVASASNYDELRNVLRRAFYDLLGLRPLQERHVVVDGQNARRVVDAVKQLM